MTKQTLTQAILDDRSAAMDRKIETALSMERQWLKEALRASKDVELANHGEDEDDAFYSDEVLSATGRYWHAHRMAEMYAAVADDLRRLKKEGWVS